jgi:integrase
MSGRQRRGRGEGSVFRRSDTGVWVGVLDLRWVDGRRRRRYVYGKTRPQVVQKLAALRREQEHGVDLAAAPRTVAEWLDEWLDEMKANDGTRPSTLTRYRIAVESHLKPGLGRYRLDRLAARDVQRFLGDRSASQSPASLVKLHAVLRVALADAERLGLVARNAAKLVRPPSLRREERRVLTVAEARRLLEKARGDRFEIVVVLGLTMGLRRGEILGLQWQDIDLDGRTVYVRRALQRVRGGLQFVEPKTHRSRRPLPIPALVTPALERHRARQAVDRLAAGELWRDNGLVVATMYGGPVEPRNVNHYFERLRKTAGLDWLRLHDLRHACATFLLAQGVDPRTVMELLGHSTIRLTMDTYGHVLPDRLHAAAEAMNRVLEP